MSDHVTSLRWLGNHLDADAADKGIGQGSEGARICWNAAIEIEQLRKQLTTALAENQQLRTNARRVFEQEELKHDQAIVAVIFGRK